MTETRELVSRLLEKDKPLMQQGNWSSIRAVIREAADALEAQADENRQLREALQRIEAVEAITPPPQPEAATPTAQEAVPVAWQVKQLHFDWQPKDRGNPSEWVIDTDDYSAYVLIPYEDGNDPSAGVGMWNGVANYRGQSGFPTKEAAMRYCEDTIRNKAERAIKNALRWIAHPPQPSASVVDALQLADDMFRDLGWHSKYEITSAALRALKGDDANG